MNREILFKAKRIDKNKGEWVIGYVSSPHSRDTEKGIVSYYFNALDEKGWVYQCIVSAETVCQYIGLSDNDANKIFENDILLWHFTNAEPDYCQCCWLEDECAFAFKRGNDYINPVDCYTEDGYFCMPVIGNIFDNKEIAESMKGEKE